jgi:hypothetical protein
VKPNDDVVEFSFERFTDGREGPHGATGSRCWWDEDTLVSEDHLEMGNVVAVMTWRYELTESGRALRATEQIRGGGRDQDNVWEFERQNG